MCSRVAKPPSLLYIDYRGEDLPPVATILPTYHMVPYSTSRVASHIPLLPHYTLHCAINRSAPVHPSQGEGVCCKGPPPKLLLIPMGSIPIQFSCECKMPPQTFHIFPAPEPECEQLRRR